LKHIKVRTNYNRVD